MDLALNNLQRLICIKPKQANQTNLTLINCLHTVKCFTVKKMIVEFGPYIEP